MTKKLKPHELRDRSTRVALKLERSERPRPILPGRHLFVTEGTKTEPNYLEGLVELIGQRYGAAAKKQFHIIGEGDNTLNLLVKAEAYQQNNADGYQHVWLIYDKDDFPSDNFDNTVSRCKALNRRFQAEGRDLTFHALWSNECFELWFLLHFDYLDASVSREQYQSMLSGHLGKPYDKKDRALFTALLPFLSRAMKNARRLMESYDPVLPPSQRAPCTAVYELLETLQAYIQ